ncbi:uncharacterized protein LY89DRAFT_742179 [Mollisia scopiformis]|uniref:DUF6594 domain-containing protein n=1 Tax=Mollisia scopiformis TaxID=149040 RepID=A0A132B8Z0_MOLSC|nr:uncharacterized protein LY89DRAFT_742179 [Mollisia scopiformis]KUJ08344.1 hypothetical protein LY89DRAFT_742179 [Mollisia scopiformis]
MFGKRDIENPPVMNPNCKVQDGFGALASWMALEADSESFVFQKFDDLSARNLLYLQCEMLDLRRQLEAFDMKVARLDARMDLKDAARTWETLVRMSAEKDPNPDVQNYKILIERLRETVKEYLRSANLVRPSNRALKALRSWVDGGTTRRPDGTKIRPILGGLARDYLDKEDGLAVIKPLDDVVLLSKMLRNIWPVKREVSRDGINLIGRFQERSITLTVNIISVVVAAILLLGSITVSISFILLGLN